MLFSTNVGDYVIADQEHPIVMRGAPFLHIRDRLKPEYSAVCFTVWWKRVNSEGRPAGLQQWQRVQPRLGDRLKRCLQNFAHKLARRVNAKKKRQMAGASCMSASLHVRVVGSTAPSGTTQVMFCDGSLMSQVLQCTQFCALIWNRGPSFPR